MNVFFSQGPAYPGIKIWESTCPCVLSGIHFALAVEWVCLLLHLLMQYMELSVRVGLWVSYLDLVNGHGCSMPLSWV